jgi:predicted alpha/beta-fold hydrolase
MIAHPATRGWSPPPFQPRRGIGNGHVMTVLAWARTRRFPGLPEPDAQLFRVTDDTQVLAHCYWQPKPATRPTLLALHGLEGSSSVHYMRGLAAQAWKRGWNAVALNQRNCGGTEHLTPGLYHSGLTADPRAVLQLLQRQRGIGPFVVAGYSLGGNLALRLAGELADTPELDLAGVAAVCPTIDLERCVHALERRRNFAYQFNFVRNLRARMRRKSRAWPRAFDLEPLASTWTIRRFDDVYTAPHHGFAGANDYYFRASAMRVVDRIRIPALIVAAEDDPFVPAEQFRVEAIRSNPWITVRIEARGGHCGFIGPANGSSDGYWAEETVGSFLAACLAGCTT